MKYLNSYKVWEAVESSILSSTLGFIKKEDRDSLMSFLKTVCSKIDFPFSQLRDEFFEYLPFKKALEKADMTGDEPCDATSAEVFPEYAIEGAKCVKGKVKRKWGAREREVVCPKCNGTGVLPKKSEVKLLKFWFNRDGEFVYKSAVDGVMRPTADKNKYSKRISDYEIGKSLSEDDVLNLQTGQVIQATISGKTIVCHIFRESGRVYAINDACSGNEPSNRSWRNYGRYSWVLARGEWQNAIELIPKSLDDDKSEADPYEWNVALSSSAWRPFEVNPNIDLADKIKSAHFAIILDFGKLKKSEFTPKDDIMQSRELSKRGSKLDPDFSDEEIKTRNIERYLKTLSSRLDITSDITNVNKLVLRTLGYKNALFMIICGPNQSNYAMLMRDYFSLMTAEDDEDKKYYVDAINNRIQSVFKSTSKSNIEITRVLNYMKQNTKASKIEVVEELIKLSETIYEKVKNIQVDCIEDFEVILQLISSVKSMFTSDRYSGTYRMQNNIMPEIYRGNESRVMNYLNDTYYTPPEAVQNLKTIRKVVERM